MSFVKKKSINYEQKINNNNTTEINHMNGKNNLNNNSIELQRFNTLEKIIKLQEDLKIVSSIKQQFEENQKKMQEKLDKFCYDYYKNKIDMTKIFDYCNDNDAQHNYEYKLLTKEQAKHILNDDIYSDIFSFLFLIRNDNNLMLKIIEYCNKDSFDRI